MLLHNLSDGLICASYFAIPVILIHYLRHRPDVAFRPIFWLFGTFILACGLTHMLEFVVFYTPSYRLVGAAKLATGLISAATVAALIRALPRALALRGIRSVERELDARRQTEEISGARNRQLETLVELSRSAMVLDNLDALAREVAALAAQGLGVGLCGVFQALPGHAGLQLCAGIGWRDGLVGTATVPIGIRPLTDLFAREAGVNIKSDPENDGRLEAALLDRLHDAAGGLGVEAQGPDGPHGILIAYTTQPKTFVLVAHSLGRPFGVDEIWFFRSVAALFGSNLGRIEAERALLILAMTDALTGLHNARYLREESRAVEMRAARDGRELSAVMIDVDNFKGYNDAFGHPAGDEVLREVGGILRSQARAGDLVARYGGEEFAILLPGADAAEAWEFAERLRRAIESYPWSLRPVTASLGVATGRPPNARAVALLAQADRALYAAKRAGRNRVERSNAPGEAGEPADREEPGEPAHAEEPEPGGPLVLLVDDDPAYRRELGRRLIGAGFRVREAGSWSEGLALASGGPDLILLEVRLVDGDGLELCRRLKADPATTAIPILALLGILHGSADRSRALGSGASAALVKSADTEELLAIALSLVRAGRVHRNLDRSVREMGMRLAEHAVKMGRFCDASIEGWVRLLELHDHETEGHSRRVTEQTARLARRMGFADDELVHVRRGALLHDIGKVGVPDAILNKPGPLDDEEWRVMHRHPELARRMLEPIGFLKPALAIPCSHHERWDGAGYPEGLSGEAIPLAARIFAAMDIQDALGHNRPYRKAWPAPRVLAHIKGLAGTHLDPRVVEVLLGISASASAHDLATGGGAPLG